MKAGIAVDDWKLPVFRERLTNAGFEYKDAGEVTPGTTMLHVEYADQATFARLSRVIAESAEACKRMKRGW